MMLTAQKTAEIGEKLRSSVEEALRLRGISARRASLDVVGHDGLVRDIKAGRLPSLDRVQALCEYLGIQFSFGETDDTGPVETMVIDAEDFAPIPRLDARLSAGPGAENGACAVVEKLAFRRDWLKRMGVSASEAVLVQIKGDSMEPSLHDGDLALIDKNRNTARSGQVYALVDVDGQTRVKRVDLLPSKGLVLRSDSLDYPAEARLGDDANRVRIIGQVVWSGHSW